MPRRLIIQIDEDKCNGCGECVTSCAEGALAIVDGKAKLVSETYCDGLGACLNTCPEDAITIIEREADAFDEAAASRHMVRRETTEVPVFRCPSAAVRTLRPPAEPGLAAPAGSAQSELGQWPVQLSLVPPSAPYFQGADLVLVADCVPFALPDLHQRVLAGRAVAVACPKLDDAQAHVDKLAEVLRQSSVKSLTVVHMEVPCCFGLKMIAEQALAASGKTIPLRNQIVTIAGQMQSEETPTSLRPACPAAR